MKFITKILFALIFTLTALTTKAQDTLYIYNDGVVINKYDIATDIDSIIFYQPVTPGIEADLILEYALEITTSEAEYAAGSITVAADQIATLFGITQEELLAGIEQKSGSPEITGFAIEGGSFIDNLTSSNTNAKWGHWWDANGNVINWGDGAMLAAEFDTTTRAFNIAQFPGHLVDGQVVTFIEGLQYGEFRATVVITVTATTPAEVVYNVISTQDLNIDIEPKSSYDVDSLQFDLTQALADLGVGSVDDVSFVGVKADGSIATGYTANAPGYWYDMNGYVSTWGDSSSVYVTHLSDSAIGVGQYPDSLFVGKTLLVKYGLLSGENIVMLNIAVNVIEPVVSTQDLSISILPKSTYEADSLQFDLTQALTDLGVSSMDEVTFIGVNEDGSYAKAYTADAPGYWYDMNGNVGNWGVNSSVYTAYGAFVDDHIGIGQYPDHLSAGESYEIKYGLLANNKIVMLNINIEVLSYLDPETPPEGEPTTLELTVDLTKSYSNDYASVTEDLKATLRDAFKMTTYQIHQAIGTGALKLYQGAISATDPSYTATPHPGYWLKADGTVGAWGESVVWCNIGSSETELFLNGGNHPDNVISGTGVTVSTVLIATLNGGQVTLNITFTVNPAPQP